MYSMDHDKSHVKADRDLQVGDFNLSILNNNDELECMSLHNDITGFSCIGAYDVSNSSLIKSPLVTELLLSHGLLQNENIKDKPNSNFDSESKICSIEDCYGPPSFLRIYSFHPPTNKNNEREDSDDENGDFKCGWELCDKNFSSRKDLSEHLDNEHVWQDENSLYRCNWSGCPRQGKAINARYRMLVHLRTHTRDKPHECDVCNKRFSRLENLKIHIRSHTGEKPYVCLIAGCNKAYSNSSDRFKHLKTHQEDKPYVCRVEGCDKRYTDPSSLRKHMKSFAHSGESSQKPSVNSQVSGSENGNIQNKSYLNSTDIYCSMKKKTKIIKTHRPYACKVEGCNKKYTDPSSLRKHLRTTPHGKILISLKLK